VQTKCTRIAGLLVVALALAASIAGSGAAAGAVPTITGISPAHGPVGTTVMIDGTNFAGTVTVAFGGVVASNAQVSNSGASQITATVPAKAKSGPITVTTGAGMATSMTMFKVTKAALPVAMTKRPAIVTFSPGTGGTRTKVTIRGHNFGGAISVMFGGVKAATYTVSSTSHISAWVPANAKSGKISVRTKLGTAMSSARFSVR
jgi:IPT/TIG domain